MLKFLIGVQVPSLRLKSHPSRGILKSGPFGNQNLSLSELLLLWALLALTYSNSEHLSPKPELFQAIVPSVQPNVKTTCLMHMTWMHPMMRLQLPSIGGELTLLAGYFIEVVQLKHCTVTWWLPSTLLTILEAPPMPPLICMMKNLGRSSSLKLRSLRVFLMVLFWGALDQVLKLLLSWWVLGSCV